MFKFTTIPLLEFKRYQFYCNKGHSKDFSIIYGGVFGVFKILRQAQVEEQSESVELEISHVKRIKMVYFSFSFLIYLLKKNILNLNVSLKLLSKPFRGLSHGQFAIEFRIYLVTLPTQYFFFNLPSFLYVLKHTCIHTVHVS